MRKNTVWPEIHLDHSPNAETLRIQIERQIASAIRDSKLTGGARLPSSRLMAKWLTVSRGTVVDAYEALIETGMIVTSAGSGVHVAPASPTVPNFSNLKKAAAAAHYPARVFLLNDQDGTQLYLNVFH